jgi:hypothetical protein
MRNIHLHEESIYGKYRSVFSICLSTICHLQYPSNERGDVIVFFFKQKNLQYLQELCSIHVFTVSRYLKYPPIDSNHQYTILFISICPSFMRVYYTYYICILLYLQFVSLQCSSMYSIYYCTESSYLQDPCFYCIHKMNFRLIFFTLTQHLSQKEKLEFSFQLYKDFISLLFAVLCTFSSLTRRWGPGYSCHI